LAQAGDTRRFLSPTTAKAAAGAFPHLSIMKCINIETSRNFVKTVQIIIYIVGTRIVKQKCAQKAHYISNVSGANR
jgi:tRNA G18 (ribose-2'-O)-methylase SpoU